ncbi:MAG TPA: hypothetical protein VL882_25930 [Vicinamibacterales bacterium]|jgi:hypothetical protein|nr:hypothetical protein [Vicinamibacterales bacterium]
MDFIERILGVAPDGGNGSTELMILVIIACVAAAVLQRRHLLRSVRE